jgi:PAS domain S-box-containing protein
LRLWRYLGAVLITAAAVLCRFVLEPWVGTEFPFVTFFPATAIVAWLAGVGPAIVSIVLAVVAANMFFLLPPFALELSGASWAGIHLVYLAASALIIAAGSVVRYRHRRLADESEALLAAIVDTSDDAIVSKTLEGVILSWNAGAERLFGYSAAEAVGQSINLIVPLHLRDEEVRILERLRCGERINHFETTRVRKDGELVDISVTVSPVRDSSGNVTGASKVARDITDRKRAEEKILASEQRYRAVVECQTEMLCRFAVDGTMLFVNEAYARALHMTADALIGRVFWDFIPDEEHARIKSMLERLTVESPESRLENRFETAAGVRWTLWTNRALRFDEQGRAVELQSTGIDITERKTMEEALQKADEHKNEFLAVLGHELRNPLAPLRTGLDLLEKLDGSREASKNTLGMMRRQLDHLVYLVDDLLDVSRISRGRIELKRRVLDVRNAIKIAVELARPVITEHEQDLICQLGDELLPVIGDEDRLAQVVGNLLGNAAKYSKPNGTIRLSAGREDGAAVIRVRDTGYGIPAERLGQVFDMFSQVPEHHTSTGGGGLGIGLSIARELVLAHGGSIEARSDGIGCGSEFTVRLPLSDAAADDQSPEVSRELAIESACVSRRVLVVDDNGAAAESLRTLLEGRGHTVATANDGVTALKVADKFGPEVVVLDIGLPNLDGYEVARRIRAMPGGADKLLLAVTGWGQDEDKQLAREAGFDRHLTKPVDSAYLASLIAVAEWPPSNATD